MCILTRRSEARKLAGTAKLTTVLNVVARLFTNACIWHKADGVDAPRRHLCTKVEVLITT